MRKIAPLLIVLFCVCATAQTYNPGSVKKYGFWDTQYQEPIIILNDSTLYRGLDKTKISFPKLDLDDSNLKALIPLQIKDTLFLVEQSGGIVVKYYNRTFERIDESRTHHNQYHSIPFVYEDQIFLLGGYGMFTDKNILTTYSFNNKEWFETKTYGEKPAIIRDQVIHARADDTIYFIGCDTVEDLKISPQGCWVYSLDLTTMTFSRLGNLAINSYRELAYEHHNPFTDKVITQKFVSQDENGLRLFDFKNNTYIDNYDPQIHQNFSSSNVLNQTGDKLHVLKHNGTFKVDLNLKYKTVSEAIYQRFTGKKHPIYTQKYNDVFYYAISFVIVLVLSFFVYYARKRLTDYNYVSINTKSLEIKHKGKLVTIFDETELKLLFKLANSRGQYMPFSDVIDIFKKQTDSYETLRKKRKHLMTTLSDKFEILLKNNQEPVFIYKIDPEDKRAKLIRLNKHLVRVI